MKRGPRLNLSISQEVRDDLTKRKKTHKWNSSRFFEAKYREEFLYESNIKQKILFHKTEIRKYDERLAEIKASKLVRPEFDSKRCPICSFLYSNISFRKKRNIYKGFYCCSGCASTNRESIKKHVDEIKARELEGTENVE